MITTLRLSADSRLPVIHGQQTAGGDWWYDDEQAAMCLLLAAALNGDHLGGDVMSEIDERLSGYVEQSHMWKRSE